MSIGDVLIAIGTGLAANECCEVAPWCARGLVRWSARRRYTDPARAAVRAEEWAALIDDRPGHLFKLITAMVFAGGAVLSMARRYGACQLRKVWTRKRQTTVLSHTITVTNASGRPITIGGLKLTLGNGNTFTVNNPSDALRDELLRNFKAYEEVRREGYSDKWGIRLPRGGK